MIGSATKVHGSARVLALRIRRDRAATYVIRRRKFSHRADASARQPDIE
jgi:hypothetical protein